MEKILLIVSNTTGFSVKDIIGNSREAKLVATRAYITRKAAERGYKDSAIGYWLNKERTSIIHYRKHYKPTYYYELLEIWNDQTLRALLASTPASPEA